MKMRMTVTMVCALLAGYLYGADRVWTGGGDGKDWFVAANWSPADNFPQAGDNVTVGGTTALLLTNSTAALGALAITNATITVSDWATTINATNFALRNKGTITLPGAFQNNAMSNRVHIVADSVAINSGGKIDVDGKGYMVSNGPGCPGPAAGSNSEGGGGYGGRGADESRAAGGAEYGTAAAPIAPGSGGRRYTGSAYPTTSGAGGGAVRIAADSVIIDGTITAKGTVGSSYDGGGSGGGVWVTAHSFGGSGKIDVAGGEGGPSYGGGGGGGGRIAIEYEEIVGDCAVEFSATPGKRYTTEAAGMGTLYLPDRQLVTPQRLTKQFHDVRLIVPDWHEWAVDSLTLTAKAVCLGEAGFKLTVTNDLVVQSNAWLAVGTKALSSGNSLGFTDGSAAAVLQVGGDVVVRGGTLSVGGFDQSGPTWIDIGGDLTLTNTPANSGYFYVGPGPTNNVVFTNGAVVTVGGDFSIAANAWYYPLALPKAAGTVRLVCRNLTIQAGGGINANANGYYSYSNIAYGPGAGVSAGSRGGGGGHGGRGGNGGENKTVAGGAVCGSPLLPLDAGSAGGYGYSSGPGYSIGGGYVRLETGKAIIDGVITANGTGSASQYGGGGAGGGVFIMCDTFAGSGSGFLQANGGNGGGIGGGGGGGRIAVSIGMSQEKQAMLLAGVEIEDLYVYDYHSPFRGALSVGGGTGISSGDSGSAVFMTALEGTVTLEVRGDYDLIGAPYPYPYGVTIGLQRDTLVTNYVATPVGISSGVRGACIGWRVEDYDNVLKAQGGSTNAVFEMTDDLVQTWLWTNEYKLVVNTGPGGTVNSEVVDGWHTNGCESAVIVATPETGYAFKRWIGDINDAQREMNPLVLTMEYPRTIQAEFYSLSGGLKRWYGNGNWEDYAKWEPAGAPGPFDDVVIVSGSLLASSPCNVKSLVVSNSATVIFSNWNSTLTVTKGFRVCQGGIVTLPGAFQNNEMSNRVHIVAESVVIDSGGKIDVDGKGYMVSNGPGCPGPAVGSNSEGGGGYGGRGADESRAAGGAEYGSAAAPVAPGSGGRRYTGSAYPTTSGAGGGAVRIAADSVVVDGIITAKGTAASGFDGGGSGGGVWITAHSFGGSGKIDVAGGEGGTSYSGGGAGGGRIAIEYEEIVGDCAIEFSATPGKRYTTEAAGMGTLYLPDRQLITPQRLTKYFHNVRLIVPDWNEWAVDSLTLTAKAVCLGEAGFKLTVTNDLVVQSNAWLAVGTKALSSRNSLGFTDGNAAAVLEVGGDVVVRGGTLSVGGFDQSGPTWIDIGGDLTLTNTPANSGYLYVGPGPTNNVVFTNGAAVTVGGDFTIAANAWYYPLALPKVSGTVRLSCRNLTIQTGGGINADAAGYYSYSDAAYGPGVGISGGSRGGGGGHGGRGGNGGENKTVAGGVVCGSPLLPLDAGSAGGFGHSPQPGYSIGGGYVRLETGKAIIDGVITANGTDSASTYGGGGAGGGVFIMCDTFVGSGSGLLRANGGKGDGVAGGGGGGRIAVWTWNTSAEMRRAILAGEEISRLEITATHPDFAGEANVDGGTGVQAGESGTVAFIKIPYPMGTMLLLR